TCTRRWVAVGGCMTQRPLRLNPRPEAVAVRRQYDLAEDQPLACWSNGFQKKMARSESGPKSVISLMRRYPSVFRLSVTQAIPRVLVANINVSHLHVKNIIQIQWATSCL